MYSFPSKGGHFYTKTYQGIQTEEKTTTTTTTTGTVPAKVILFHQCGVHPFQ